MDPLTPSKWTLCTAAGGGGDGESGGDGGGACRRIRPLPLGLHLDVRVSVSFECRVGLCCEGVFFGVGFSARVQARATLGCVAEEQRKVSRNSLDQVLWFGLRPNHSYRRVEWSRRW